MKTERGVQQAPPILLSVSPSSPKVAAVVDNSTAPSLRPNLIHSNHNKNNTKKMNNGGLSTIGTKPTLLEVKPMRFLIMDAPRRGNLHLYIKEMRNQHVTDLVRVCEPTYEGSELNSAGIVMHDMEYPDGHSPPVEVIERWLDVVDKVFYSEQSHSDNASIAVHCVAGLGRAPVMVAIALIEFANMDPVEAVTLIRKHRRGAINEKQLLYLERYKKIYRKKKNATEGSCGCIIS